MVTISCLLIGLFLILQTHGTSVRPAGCNGDPNAEIGCDTCGTNCDNYHLEPRMCSRRACRIDECKCKDGFVRNSEGLCIPYEKCPPLCGTNEVHSACDGKCQKTCKKKNPVSSRICTPGCICEPNYVRDDNTDECIKEDQCPLVCGRNEVVSRCNGHCQNTCTISRPICRRFCKQGCVCRSGYVRDDNTGKCIKQRNCPKIRCGKNEVKTNCLPACGQDTCERAGKKPSVCNTFAPVACKAGCVCRKNFFRNADNVCTSTANCLKCQKPNEVSGSGGACEKTCASLTKRCLSIWFKRHSKKCICRKGFARNKGGQCIPISQCPKKHVKCRVHEEYKCVKPCPPKTCQTRLALIKCAGNQKCVNKCECKDNYLRNKKGRCVLASLCDGRKKCRKPNEVSGGILTCDKTCASLTKPCNIKNKRHHKKCICKKGYARNGRGQCIPINQCPKKCPKPNEVSGGRLTCDKTCASLTKPCNIKNKRHHKKCICRKGYARNGRGQCIPINQCPKKHVKCRVHEEYKCVKPCPPKNCQARYALHKCAANQKCVNKCECKANYLRNKRGRCVLASRCHGRKTCQKPNEVSGSRHTCEKTCGSLTKPCRRFRNKRRPKKCFCKKGYARNRRGQCIPISKCPKKSKCKKNEVFACHITCPPKTCMAMVARIICPKDNPCKKQCDCKDNYARNSNGICIPSNQCFPSMTLPKDDYDPPTKRKGRSQPEDEERDYLL